MKIRVRQGKVRERRARKPGRTAAVLLPSFFGLALLAAPLAAQDLPPRLIKVGLAVDQGIENRAEWRIAAARLLGDCFRTFRHWFPLDLRLENITTWSPGPGRRPMAERLGELRRSVRRGSCDIVLGVILPERTEAFPLGLASYVRADILVKNLASREAMSYAVLHELCHVFGAADIREEGSIMDFDRPAFSVDAFTSQVVRLNAGRSFGRASHILPAPSLDTVISLFEDRARRGSEESEVPFFLTLLYLEKNDFDSAARACSAAAAADPRFPDLHDLMGLVHLFRGEYDLAIADYREAARAKPYSPGILFNLGLAFVQEGLLDDASAAFREALKADPGFTEARRALELVAGAGQDPEAVKAAVRPFVLALKKTE
jgi:tetratricopeptide (TPR) repeat protein